MDLKKIVNHRHKCLICDGQMKFCVFGNPNLNIDCHEGGLRISSGHSRGIMMLFGFDGKYTRGKRNYNIYKLPISIIRQCDNCKEKSPETLELPTSPLFKGKLFKGKPSLSSIILKPRSAGLTTVASFHTSLNNMKTNECSYSFHLMGDAEGNYDGSMSYETIRYHNDDAFWHMNISHNSGTSTLTHSSYEAKIPDVLNLRIPAPINLSGVENVEQYLSKYKMYMLMS